MSKRAKLILDQPSYSETPMGLGVYPNSSLCPCVCPLPCAPLPEQMVLLAPHASTRVQCPTGCNNADKRNFQGQIGHGKGGIRLECDKKSDWSGPNGNKVSGRTKVGGWFWAHLQVLDPGWPELAGCGFRKRRTPDPQKVLSSWENGNEGRMQAVLTRAAALLVLQLVLLAKSGTHGPDFTQFSLSIFRTAAVFKIQILLILLLITYS